MPKERADERQVAVEGPCAVRVFGGLAVGPRHVSVPGRGGAVLATLLLAHGSAATTDELIAVLWGTEPPRTARNQVHRLVSQLRTLFDDLSASGEAPIVVGAGDGYRIPTERVDCDLHTFDSLVETARERARTGETDDATELYVAALELARHAPFAGLEPHLGSVPAHVALERRMARTASDALALSLAHRIDERLVELAEEVGQRAPFDEVLQGHLVRALGRAGRRSDALALYEAVRGRLRDELGLDPSPDLQAAQADVLRLDASPAAPAGLVPSTPAPAQLPRVPSGLVTRPEAEVHLAAARAGELGTSPIVALGGMGGIGKTTLAVAWAHEIAHLFPDGQLYLNLRGFDAGGHVMSALDALANLLGALGVSPAAPAAGVDARAAQLRTALVGKRVLIVLDNARDSEQVRPLLPGAPDSMVIVTSRDRLVGLVVREGATPVHLDRMTDEQARSLVLRRLAPRSLPEPVVDRLVHMCAGLPLALSIVTSRLMIQSGANLSGAAAHLETLGPMSEWSADPDADVRSVFAWSLDSLSAEAARLFRLVGLHPGEAMSLESLASVAGSTLRKARGCVDELVVSSLLDEARPGWFAVHDLLRLYAAELVDAEPGRDEAERRLVQHYVETTRAACSQFESDPYGETDDVVAGVTPLTFATSAEATDWYRHERAVIPLVIDLARRRGHLRAAANIALDRRPMSATVDPNGDSLPQELDALSAASSLGDPLLEAELSRVVAARMVVLGDAGSAVPHLDRARQLYMDLDDRAGQSAVLRTEARLAIVQDDFPSAIDRASRAVDAGRDGGRTDLETLALFTRGEALYGAGRWQESMDAYRQALSAVRDHRWTALEMLPRVHILRCLLRLGLHDQVVAEGLDALDASTGEDLVNEAAVCSWIAAAGMTLGAVEVTRRAYERFRHLVGNFSDDTLRLAMDDEFDDCLRAAAAVEQWLAGRS